MIVLLILIARIRKKVGSNNNLDKPLSASTLSGSISSYDTDDQTDQMMDMLVKSATAGEKKSRIRKNRARDAKSTRKSGNTFSICTFDLLLLISLVSLHTFKKKHRLV